MARDFQINGEALILVKFGEHIPTQTPFATGGDGTSNLSELGLASDSIRISPNLKHKGVFTDDFGPDLPVEIMALMLDVSVDMTLIHYDDDILDACLAESTGADGNIFAAGVPALAGTLLGNNRTLLASGCHFMSLNIRSPILNKPYRFRSAFLTSPPLEFPIGTTKTAVKLSWKAIPYTTPTVSYSGEVRGASAVIWDRTLDT